MDTYRVTGFIKVNGTPRNPHGYRLELNGVYYSGAAYSNTPINLEGRVGTVISSLQLAQTPFAGELIPKR